MFKGKKFNTLINKLPKYLKLVGSAGRGKEYPNDIDLVSLNNKLDKVSKWFEKNFDNITIIKSGDRYLELSLKIDKKKIIFNIWYATKKEYPLFYFWLAYPKTFVVRVRGAFKKKGYILSQYELLNDKGKRVIIKNYKDVFKVLKKLGYNYTFRTPEEQELKGKGLKEKVFKTLANNYRKVNCNGKARDLLDGEYHYGCHNFTGPGTRIDLSNVLNYPVYNDIDACSKQHDIDYNKAQNSKDKEKLIREADKKVIDCYNKYPNENGYEISKLGINSKITLENAIPDLMNFLTGSYYGK